MQPTIEIGCPFDWRGIDAGPVFVTYDVLMTLTVRHELDAVKLVPEALQIPLHLVIGHAGQYNAVAESTDGQQRAQETSLLELIDYQLHAWSRGGCDVPVPGCRSANTARRSQRPRDCLTGFRIPR